MINEAPDGLNIDVLGLASHNSASLGELFRSYGVSHVLCFGELDETIKDSQSEQNDQKPEQIRGFQFNYIFNFC